MGGDDVRRTEIALLEFSSDVTLDKGGLSGATITDQKHFELGGLCARVGGCGARGGGRGRYRLSHCLILSLRAKRTTV